jgi:hypothetical protein
VVTKRDHLTMGALEPFASERKTRIGVQNRIGESCYQLDRC